MKTYERVYSLDDKNYIEKWKRFDKWVKGLVPLAVAAVNELINDQLINKYTDQK